MVWSFDEAYRGTPPWDIGRPQTEFVKLARTGELRGSVLDVGCGTGENAIYFASLGFEVLGLDSARRAVEKAKKKALERGARAEFAVGNALHLGRLGRTFDTVTDCGLFHTFSDEERVVFVESLGVAMKRTATYFVLCFSDKEPDWGGPRRLTEGEILEAFRNGWKVNYVREAKFSSTFNEQGGEALLSSITRL